MKADEGVTDRYGEEFPRNADAAATEVGLFSKELISDSIVWSEKRRNKSRSRKDPDLNRTGVFCNHRWVSCNEDKKYLRSASATGYGNKIKTLDWEAELKT
jgi:hypothetical protein